MTSASPGTAPWKTVGDVVVRSPASRRRLRPAQPLLFMALTAWTASMLMLWSPVRAAPARYLPQITAEYMISYLGVDVGRSRLELRAISKGRYRLKLRTRTIGVIQPVYPLRHQAESRVNLGDNEIRPVRFLWETRLWGPPERHTIHFDWRKRRATVWREDERIIVPLPEGSSYLGFIFARAGTAEQAENALREAHACLNIVVAPLWKGEVAS